MSNPDALRLHAADATFVSGDHHYPGIRAPLPDHYMPQRPPIPADPLRFRRHRIERRRGDECSVGDIAGGGRRASGGWAGGPRRRFFSRPPG
ncbi:MAG: hypothetical protein OSB00_17420 [Sphingomonas bacterium]|nr:hypothetical protein [Sphingomonas bacterium]